MYVYVCMYAGHRKIVIGLNSVILHTYWFRVFFSVLQSFPPFPLPPNAFLSFKQVIQHINYTVNISAS